MERKCNLIRKTFETEIHLDIDIDGNGESNINTGIGFLDHMLTLFSKHGLFGLNITAKGDLHIDSHHTVEDTGILLGQALKEAIGNKKSIKRYGTAFVPMDEALSMVCIDISGRPFLVYDVNIPIPKIGTLETETIEEFFNAFVSNAGVNLHIKVLYGTNTHHIIEAVFKAFGRALDEATQIDTRIDGVLSTKGIL